MVSAPSEIAWSRNALNLISALQSTSGLGVRPARYSARKLANTLSLYSAEKFTASMSMPIFSAADTASTRSSRVVQCSASSSSSQFFMKSATTSWPARLSKSAATAESTPPDIPTTTFMTPRILSAKKKRRGARPRLHLEPGRLLLAVGLRGFLRGVGLRGVGGLGRVGFRLGLGLGFRLGLGDLLLGGLLRLLHVGGGLRIGRLGG